MPRVGGEFVAPYPDVVPDTTIESEVHNGTVADLVLDANTPRPITAGGTGAASPAAARANLNTMVAIVTVTNYDSQVWENGSFWSAAGATGAPNPTSVFTGFAALAGNDQDHVSLTATDQTTGLNYSRIKNTTWDAWVVTDLNDKVSVIGDTMTGNLAIAKATPQLELQGTSGTDGRIKASQAGLAKWEMVLGLNIGGDFILYGYDDAGTIYPGTPPLRIARNGITVFGSNVSTAGTASAATFICNNGAGNALYRSIGGERTWIAGTWNDGVWRITDETAPAHRLTIDGGGHVTVGGTLGCGGNFTCGASITAQGISGRRGVGGVTGSVYNFYWDGGALQAWVDTAYLGNVSFASADAPDLRAAVAALTSALQQATTRIEALEARRS